MPIETNIQFGAAVAATRTAVQAETQPAVTTSPATTPVLDGPGVRVSVTGSQLDKLVAKVKGETEDARLDSAKRRIAIVLATLAALNIRVTDGQKNALVQIELLQGQLEDLAEKLKSATDELSEAEAQSVAMDAQIAALETAVENAIKEGEEHRKLVAELKKTRAADDAELQAAEAALAKSEAAIAAAKLNLSKAQSEQTTAKEKVAFLKNSIATLKSQIASAEKSINDYVATLGDNTLAALATALRTTAAETAPANPETPADREKDELKEIANDPFRVIRESLDRMDADILGTIEENRTHLV